MRFIYSEADYMLDVLSGSPSSPQRSPMVVCQFSLRSRGEVEGLPSSPFGKWSVDEWLIRVRGGKGVVSSQSLILMGLFMLCYFHSSQKPGRGVVWLGHAEKFTAVLGEHFLPQTRQFVSGRPSGHRDNQRPRHD